MNCPKTPYNIFMLECFFSKIGQFSNVHFKGQVYTLILCLQFEKINACKSISSILRPHEVDKNVPSKNEHPVYYTVYRHIHNMFHH